MNSLRLLPILLASACPLLAGPLSPAAQTRLDAKITEIKTWAATPALIDAVVAQNATPPADYLAMTQEKWALLPADAPLVQSFTTHPVGVWLKSKQTPWVSEAFVSDAAGRKVAFLAKPTHWSHVGAAKHDQPLLGKVWQGAPELDASTGLEQIQVAVPVLAAGKKPVGSLVVGIPVAKLE